MDFDKFKKDMVAMYRAGKSRGEIAEMMRKSGLVNRKGSPITTQDVSYHLNKWGYRTLNADGSVRKYPKRSTTTTRKPSTGVRPEPKSQLLTDVTELLTSNLESGLKARLLVQLVGSR